MYKLADLMTDLKLSMYAQRPMYNEQTEIGDGEHIIRLVCAALSVKPTDVKSKSRKQELSDARHIICYILRKHSTLSARQVGNKLGGRDHSTVLSSVITCQEFIDNNDSKIIKKIGLVNAYLPQDLCI